MKNDGKQSRKDQEKFNANKNKQHMAGNTGQRNVPSEKRGPQGQ